MLIKKNKLFVEEKNPLAVMGHIILFLYSCRVLPLLSFPLSIVSNLGFLLSRKFCIFLLASFGSFFSLSVVVFVKLSCL